MMNNNDLYLHFSDMEPFQFKDRIIAEASFKIGVIEKNSPNGKEEEYYLINCEGLAVKRFINKQQAFLLVNFVRNGY